MGACFSNCSCCCEPDPFPFDDAEAAMPFSGPLVSSDGLHIPEDVADQHHITQPEIRIVVHAANRFFHSQYGQELLTEFAVRVSQTLPDDLLEQIHPLPSRPEFRQMVAGLMNPEAPDRLQLPVLYTRACVGDAEYDARRNRPELHSIECLSVTQIKQPNQPHAYFTQQVSFNIVR
jgi:hypothetical protein